ncbi:hypothetical protein HPSSW114_0751 [Glaesserella parasuis SW114]|nr:hypothetical protein HPSSW114_0751 [Glaesserella parasuis SW114]
MLKNGLKPYITGFKPLFLNYEPKNVIFATVATFANMV